MLLCMPLNDLTIFFWNWSNNEGNKLKCLQIPSPLWRFSYEIESKNCKMKEERKHFKWLGNTQTLK